MCKKQLHCILLHKEIHKLSQNSALLSKHINRQGAVLMQNENQFRAFYLFIGIPKYYALVPGAYISGEGRLIVFQDSEQQTVRRKSLEYFKIVSLSVFLKKVQKYLLTNSELSGNFKYSEICVVQGKYPRNISAILMGSNVTIKI